MDRVCLYNEIHKAIRRELCTLLVDAASADPSSSTDAASIAARTKRLAGFLDDHAGHEDQWIEPLIQELQPDLARDLHSEHEALERELESLLATVDAWSLADDAERASLGATAHSCLAGFTGRYLSHMSREENDAMPVLQAAMSDADLLGIATNLRASIPPPRMGEFLAIMIPAMNVTERTMMFSGMKAAPPEALAGASRIAASVLAESEWAEVRSRAGL